MKKFFAFDIGKKGLGYCCREGSKIHCAGSLTIEPDHSSVEDIRNNRKAIKTRLFHKAREEYFNKLWHDEAGLEILDKDDERFKIEFSKQDDERIYNSTLLRIALLQNRELEKWQIYKALHNAFQRRGYDSELPWKNSGTKADEENEKLAKNYTQKNGQKLIKKDKFQYPCYYDALALGMWKERNPYDLQKIVSKNPQKIRTGRRVAPRKLVIKELTDLWTAAQKQIPELQKISADKFLYGEYREPYASYTNPDWHKNMGKEKDWQGVLGQKIPRFNNRIISKCKLLPKRNVCSADTIENIVFTLLYQLKNFRYTNSNGEVGCRLAPTEIKEIYDNNIQNWMKNLYDNKKNNKSHTFTVSKTEIEKVIGKGQIYTTKSEKFKSFQANTTGRSSFCRRALQIMNEIILTGTEPKDVNISKFIDKSTTNNPITEDEIKEMLSKISDRNELYIPDNSMKMAEFAQNPDIQSDLIIGSITNPIIRNRLQIFKNLLNDMIKKYGKPDEVIFEFVKDGKDNSLFGAEKAKATEQMMRINEKKNEEIRNNLSDDYSAINFLKYKLAEMQDWTCIYSGRKIEITDFDACEIDHIFPRTDDTNDALYNKVICYKEEIADKHGRTPYEWMNNNTARWQEYIMRVKSLSQKSGKTKTALLTLSPTQSEKFLEKRKALNETTQIAKIVQSVTAFVLGWDLEVKDERRHIFISNGSSTHKIRQQYKLDRLLDDNAKKNRENGKHRALDAICISYSKDFQYNTQQHKYEIENIDIPHIEDVIKHVVPYPYTNDKPLKSALTPAGTIYGKKVKNGKTYITKRIALLDIKKDSKSINKISDNDIKSDLLNKSGKNLSDDNWVKILSKYTHPKRGTKVKKVIVLEEFKGQITFDSNGRERLGEYCDFGNKGTKGQFKHSKQHRGQILYFNEKGKIKVMPVYANKKVQDVKDELINMGCKLYHGGEMFYSGCLIEIPNDFKAGGNIQPKGIYKVSTITTAGLVKIENNSGNIVHTNLTHITEADFRKFIKRSNS